MLAPEVRTSMESPEQFIKYVPWTPAEKKAARRAFDEALGRHLSAIIAEAKRRMANVVDPSDLWELETYLTESRKTVDRIYQYRYSDLLRVILDPHAGWLAQRCRPGRPATRTSKAPQRPYAGCLRIRRRLPKAPETRSDQLKVDKEYCRGNLPLRRIPTQEKIGWPDANSCRSWWVYHFWH